eukprot:891780-Prymnesium_polylepis.1
MIAILRALGITTCVGDSSTPCGPPIMLMRYISIFTGAFGRSVAASLSLSFSLSVTDARAAFQAAALRSAAPSGCA